MDLFTTSQDKTHNGAINLNTQFNIRNAAGDMEQGALPSLISAIPIGPMKDGLGTNLGGTTLNAFAVKTISATIANRRNAFASKIASPYGPGGLGDPAPIDNNPRRPLLHYR